MFRYDRTVLGTLFFITFLLFLSSNGSATSPKGPFTVTLDIPGDPPSIGTPMDIELTVVSRIDAERTKAVFEFKGDLTVFGEKELNLGSLKAGVPKKFRISVRINSPGKHEIHGSVHLIDEQGNSSYFRQGRLYLLAYPDEVLISQSSFINMELERLSTRRSRNLIDEKSFQQGIRDIMNQGVIHRPPSSPEPWTEKMKNDQELYDQIYAKYLKENGIKKEVPTIDKNESRQTITVTGKASWTDRLGVTHPIRFAKVEIINTETFPDSVIASHRTLVDGSYEAVITGSDATSTPDIFVRVSAISSGLVAQVESAGFNIDYSLDTEEKADVAQDTPVLMDDLIANNTTESGAAWSVFDAVVEISMYAQTLTGSLTTLTVPPIPVEFPRIFGQCNNFTPSISCYQVIDKDLIIGFLDKWDWDVIHHEYGHFIGELTDIKGGVSGDHSTNEHMIGFFSGILPNSRSKGLRIAFGESWPTFFALSGQQEMNTAALGIPLSDGSNVLVYNDIEDANLRINIEGRRGAPELGEDGEASIMRILWDFYDSNSDQGDDNGVALGDKFILNSFINLPPVTFLSQAWNVLIVGQSVSTIVNEYAPILVHHQVAPFLQRPNTNFKPTPGEIPTFQWETKGAGPDQHLNVFKVNFYDKDFTNLIFESNIITTTSPSADEATYTPSGTEWQTILNALNNEVVINWFVKGLNDRDPNTGPYYSTARTIGPGDKIAFVIDTTISMKQEISGVRTALTRFIDALKFLEDPPTIELVTFRDRVIPGIITNDLAALQAEVNSLSALGGGDCPEASVPALRSVVPRMENGGRILFITDASPYAGTDIQGTINLMRSKGIRVDVLLSGDCAGSFRFAGENILPYSSNNDGPENRTHGGISAVIEFSRLAFETGGTFITIEEVNDLGTGPIIFEQAALNVMLGIINPTVTSFFPQRVPQGATLDILINGSNTNFKDHSAISFGTTIFPTSTPTPIPTPTQTPTNTPTPGPATFTADTLIVDGASFNADIDLAGDEDWYKFSVSSGDIVNVFTTGTTNTFMWWYNNLTAAQMENFVESDNDDGVSTNASITRTVTFSGTIYVKIRHSSSTGTGPYSIQVINMNPTPTSTPTPNPAPLATTFTINSKTVISLSQIKLNITVPAGLPEGFYDISVNTSLGRSTESASGSGVVEVVPPTGNPEIVSVSPSVVEQSSSQTVTLYGQNTNFDSTSTLMFIIGTGVNVNDENTAITVEAGSLVVDSPTKLSVTVNVGSDAEPVFHQIRVTTGAEIAKTSNVEFFLVTPPITEKTSPVISSISPASAIIGKTTTITITGENTGFVSGESLLTFSGTGITIVSGTVVSETQVIAQIQIDSGASLGSRDVFVTTGLETASSLDGFEVINLPTIPAMTLITLIVLVLLISLYVLRSVKNPDKPIKKKI